MPKSFVEKLHHLRGNAAGINVMQKMPSIIGPTGRARNAINIAAKLKSSKSKSSKSKSSKSKSSKSKSSKSKGGRKTRRHKKRIA